MGTVDHTDLHIMCKPIDENSPCGVNLRDDVSPTSIYYRLKDMRTKARNTERRQLVDAEEIVFDANDWSELYSELPSIIETETKDLELVAWYIEAATRIDGFLGLANGFELAATLIENFWDNLYPQPDEDGVATRISPIIGLNGFGADGALIMPILGINLTSSSSANPSYATWQYERALELEKLHDDDKKEEKVQSGIIPLKSIQKAFSDSGNEYIIEQHQYLQLAIDNYTRLIDIIDEKCIEDPQPTSNIMSALRRCEDVFRYLSQDVIELKTTEEVETSPEPEVNSNNADKVVMTKHNTQTLTREKALFDLQNIANYFRESEPHSPVSYLIEQSINWSKKSLPELLQELISDEPARSDYFRLAGIRLNNKNTEPDNS